MARLASRLVIGVFAQPAEAAQAISGLHNVGFDPDLVSVLLRAEAAAAAENGTARRAGGRNALSGAFGPAANWLTGVRTAETAELGQLAGAGALVGKLAAVGHLAGALESLGLPSRLAEGFAAQVREGRVLAVVEVPDRHSADQAQEAFKRCGAAEVSYYAGKPYGTAYHGAGPGD